MFSIQTMRYICVINQEKSFSKAAQKLYVSQSWLSVAVKKEEEEIGAKLFNRDTTPISLTPAGQYYINKAESILDSVREMKNYFLNKNQSTDSDIRIGSSNFFCTYVFSRLYQDLMLIEPEIHMSLTEGSSAHLANLLKKKQLDFMIEAENIYHPDLESRPLFKEEIYLAVPSSCLTNQSIKDFACNGNGSQSGKPISLSIFSNEKFLILKEGNDLYQRSLDMCQHAGFHPKISMYLDQMMTGYYLTCEGLGISFVRSSLPNYMHNTNKIYFYRIDDSLSNRNIYLTMRKNDTLNSLQIEVLKFLESIPI